MLSTQPVPPALRGLLDAIWTFTGDGRTQRIVPDGCLDFVFDLDTGSGCVVGPMTRAQLITPPAGSRALGVRFRPGQASRFIDAHAHELLDAEGELDGLTRTRALALHLAEARTHATREAMIAKTLLDARMRTRPADARLERAIDALQRQHGRLAVSGLVERAGLGERQLERRFLERVGMGPKRLARVLRFARANALMRDGHPQIEVALRAGYSDEPHLLRDFRALCGVTPKALAQERHVGFVQASVHPDD